MTTRLALPIGVCGLILGLAGVSGAQLDRCGVYFDANASVEEYIATPLVPFDLYFCLAEPSYPLIWGFEFGYTVTEWGTTGQLVRIGVELPPEAIDVGDDENPAFGDYVVGLATPLPADWSVVLVKWQMVTLAMVDASFAVGPPRVPSLPQEWPAYEAGGIIVPMSVATTCWGAELRLNQYCPLPTEQAAFGAVKALYR